MNSSALYDRACAYLGARGAPPEELLERVAPCMDEARSLARFRAAGRTYEVPLPFLQKEPYVSFLAGCAAYGPGAAVLPRTKAPKMRNHLGLHHQRLWLSAGN